MFDPLAASRRCLTRVLATTVVLTACSAPAKRPGEAPSAPATAAPAPTAERQAPAGGAPGALPAPEAAAPAPAGGAAPATAGGAVMEWKVPSDEAIRALLAERVPGDRAGIVVGVIEPGRRRVISHGITGAADARPLDGDAIFLIGSLTKPFTALLLADMAVRGEVGLDDPAATYLPPGTKMPQRGRPITLRDLATHVSGLPSMPTNLSLRGEPDPYEAYTVEQLYRFLATYELPHEPGTHYQYSNFAVTLLGRLLAQRAGTDYETLLRRRILEPLGMTSSGITLTAEQTRRLIPGHDHFLRPVRTWEMKNMPASGSLRSTVNDMLTLLAAYLGHVETPLWTAMRRQLTEPPPEVKRSQALGWGQRPDGTFTHAGGKQGYRSGVAFNTLNGIGAVVLTNARIPDDPTSIALHVVVGKPLPAAQPAPAPIPIAKVARATLDRYAGRYRFSADETFEVARRDSHLLVHLPGSGVLEYYASGERDFFLNTGSDELTFHVDARGKITGVTYYGDGKAAGGGKLATRL